MSADTTLPRLERIAEIAARADVDAIGELLGYLDDDRLVVIGGDAPSVVELRMVALEALQHISRYNDVDVDIGRIRIAMPVAVADLLDDPPADRATAARAAIAEYERRRQNGTIVSEEHVSDPVSRSTPPQERARVFTTPPAPPPPYLRIAARQDRERTLGYVHHPADGPWRYDFARTQEGARAKQDLIMLVGRLGADSLPKVRVDDGGVALVDPGGALQLDGTIDDESADRVTYLRSLAAFADALFTTEVVTPPGASEAGPRTRE